MRILYHHRTLGLGAEGVHVRAMVAAWRALGHEVRVEALAGEPAEAGSRRSERWSALRRLIPDALYELAELAYNVVARRSLERAIAAFRPDIVYDRYNSYSTAAVTAARRFGIPCVLEVNAPVAYERSTYEHLRLRMPRLAARYERRILLAADHIVTVSAPLKRHLRAHYGLADAAISVLPNGADPVRFHPLLDARPLRAELGLADGAVVIGFTGDARPWHGLHLLVESFLRLVHERRHVWLLILGGGGSSEPALRKMVAERGLGARVRFIDRVPHGAVPAFISAMDIAVSARATFYASPLKIVEYMAAGKAIVAPAMPNIGEMLDDGHSALLFEPENVDALTHALRRLVDDRALRERLGQHARGQVEARLNWRANARRVTELAAGLRARSDDGATIPATVAVRRR